MPIVMLSTAIKIVVIKILSLRNRVNGFSYNNNNKLLYSTRV